MANIAGGYGSAPLTGYQRRSLGIDPPLDPLLVAALVAQGKHVSGVNDRPVGGYAARAPRSAVPALGLPAVAAPPQARPLPPQPLGAQAGAPDLRSVLSALLARQAQAGASRPRPRPAPPNPLAAVLARYVAQRSAAGHGQAY